MHIESVFQFIWATFLLEIVESADNETYVHDACVEMQCDSDKNEFLDCKATGMGFKSNLTPTYLSVQNAQIIVKIILLSCQMISACRGYENVRKDLHVRVLQRRSTCVRRYPKFAWSSSRNRYVKCTMFVDRFVGTAPGQMSVYKNRHNYVCKNTSANRI